MTKRPRLLDLCCGAGGAAMGYHRAGFEVVGVDINPQPRFPFEFHQADALEFPLDGFDVIHASPPCQAYSAGSRMRTGVAKKHPELIEPIRDRMNGHVYVIENVPGAPLDCARTTKLCGSMFGLAVRRHRLFECSHVLFRPECQHWKQGVVVGVYGNHPEKAVIRKGCPAIRAESVEHARVSMGIDWMQTWRELKEAIPPAYTEWIGRQLLKQIVASSTPAANSC